MLTFRSTFIRGQYGLKRVKNENLLRGIHSRRAGPPDDVLCHIYSKDNPSCFWLEYPKPDVSDGQNCGWIMMSTSREQWSCHLKRRMLPIWCPSTIPFHRCQFPVLRSWHRNQTRVSSPWRGPNLRKWTSVIKK